MSEKISILEQQFTLHPYRAMYWHEQAMLLIADVHLGKVDHFRKHGAAIPPNSSEENYTRLNALVAHFKPKTICFLGDLFHSSLNKSWLHFSAWVSASEADIILISGNHDIIPAYLFEDIGVRVLESLRIDHFLLTHHPEDVEHGFNFCGHIHPGVRMAGSGRQQLRLPCFYKTKFQLIMPAFGNFTGKYVLNPTETDDIYVIVDDEVIRVS